MMRALLCFLTSFGFSYSLSSLAETKMLDRLILEINGKSFAQRQIEVYFAVRTLARGDIVSKALPGLVGWSETLETFRQDNLIYVTLENDPQKLATLQLDHKTIQKAQERLERLQQTEDAWRNFIQRYKVSPEELVATLIRVFQIQAYLAGLGQSKGSNSASAAAFYRVDTSADWFNQLMQNSTQRFYERAREYKPIKPLGE